MHLLLDALYLIPSEDGVPYVMEQSTIKNPDMKWGWGFRFGLAEDFKHDDWRLSLLWTCLPTQNDTKTSGHLTPIWSNAPQVSGDFVEHAKVHWRLHMGIIDLDLSKKWIVSPRLELWPHAGVRFASLREKFFVRYEGGSLFPNEVDNMHSKNKFWGVGPEAGLHTEWNLWRQFCLLGKSTASIVWGEFYVHEAEREENSHIPHRQSHNVFSGTALLWELAFGLAWQGESFGCHLMWEELFFPRQNHLTMPGSVTSPSSLSVVGVSLGFDWKF